MGKALLDLSLQEMVVQYDSIIALQCHALTTRGNIVGVIGKNGAGKSTLLKTVLHLLSPTRGTLKARYLKDGNEKILRPEEDMAFCPETGSVFSDLSVERYLQFWCRVKHHDAQLYKKKGANYLTLLEVEPLLQRKGRELSKGERRRVQTAIGFLLSPKLFLFDEPFDGLDVQKTSELEELIKDHVEDTAYLISSHRMDVIERIADQLVVLKRGEVFSVGSVAEVVKGLGGASYLLSFSVDFIVDEKELRTQFPATVISRLGSQLRITGKGISSDDLYRYFSSRSRTPTIEEVPVSLVDAMALHLKDQ